MRGLGSKTFFSPSCHQWTVVSDAHFVFNCCDEGVASEQASELKMNVIPHQTQQTTDFVDGPYAAEEAHGHRQWTHSYEDVWSHFHCVWWFLW